MFDLSNVQGPLTSYAATAVEYYTLAVATGESSNEHIRFMAGEYALIAMNYQMRGINDRIHGDTALGLARLAEDIYLREA